MKILKLILENFSAVKNAMDSNKIEIDFSNTKNKVCLLIGPNGSGKTTILSMLHPFADVGNLDVRNSNNLIIKNKDGYKEIHIQKDNDIYVIKHFYTHHKDKNHSVKSYISKNDVELNVNGNVSSFKEYVKIELQIETDYLKLIRIGSNVTSLIDLTTTERKNFMSKIMDDIGIFLEYYKAVNTKLRQLDQMISHTVDKINRLGIVDKDECKENIEELKETIKEKDNLFITAHNDLTLYNNIIDNIEDSSNLKSNLNTISKKYNKMLSILDNKDKYESFDVEYYNEKIKSLEFKLLNSTNEYKSNEALIQNNLQHLNSIQEQVRSYQIQLRKEMENDDEIRRSEENLRKMRLRLREHEDLLGDYKSDVTKAEIDEFMSSLKNIQNILLQTYEFGAPPVEKVVNLLRNNKNVMNYINSHIRDIDESKNTNNSLLFYKLTKNIMFNNHTVDNCKEECPAKELFIQLQNLLKDSNVSDKNEDEHFYQAMEYVYNNLKTVIPRFNDYKDLISRFPDDIKKYFYIENIYDKISKLQVIYDEEKLNSFVSLVTEYDNYTNLMNTYEQEEKLLSKIKSISNYSYIKEQLDNSIRLLEECKEKIQDLKERNILILESNKEYQKSLEVYEEIRETIEKFSEVESLYNKYTSDYELFTDTLDKISDTKIKINKLNLELEQYNSELQKSISSLDQYKSLTKELEKMNNIYEEMVLTRDALSSKQGMPLHFISNYLSNTEEITNELLDIAYDGKIFIDNFNITATEFSIPFFNNGVRLSDVKYASQGELSFLSIALAFALSSQALSKYNIMLLDEIDGPLDVVNREKFIRILENQIDRINSEQSFLITHNSMFSSYPVDIVDLSFKNKSDEYPLANFVDIKLS